MPYMWVPSRRRRRRFGSARRAGYRRGTFRRRSYGRRYGGFRPRGWSTRGRGRYMGRARRARREVRLVVQQPSDYLPVRPVAGQFARMRRRARF